MQNLNYSHNKLQLYSNYVKKAIKYGVPVDIIIEETRKYHGNKFTDIILKKI